MEIAEKKLGDIVVLEPVGSIDTRTYGDLDRKLLDLYGAGSRHFVLDFAKVDVISSAGIRVLVKLFKMLGGQGLALCSLNEQVATVLEIAGFSGFFAIAPDVKAAMRKLKEQKPSAPKPSSPAPPPPKEDQKLESIAKLLLGDSADGAASSRTTARRAEKSKLSSHLEKLLSTGDD